MRKPTALKKLEGTYRRDRDEKTEAAERSLLSGDIILPRGSVIPCPETISAPRAREYWNELTGALLSIGSLSAVDLPQIEQLCFTLEKLDEARETFSALTPADEGYFRAQRSFVELANFFDRLASKYYVSPASRVKLALDALNCRKTAQDVSRGDDAISSLLSAPEK